ncbi:MAG: hypothetical protein B7Z67_11580 [Acidiphilium sp. 21-60-14]|nr:MAG: hypothetical protein B7Z67_11580 [Acidiphilium sp. 21-60-14]HQU42547.1 helix-turn-helix domain-containing protein [Pirellulales bacterium]
MIAPAIPDSLRDLLSVPEAIDYLRLATLPGDARERLRTLTRRQGLPYIKRGKTLWFRRAAVDAWLEAAEHGGRRR